MRDIDANAVRAKVDKACCENLILEYEPFILHVANKVTGRFITKSDDQWSVALLAFYEAIQSYSYDKGMFIPFAELVIKRRLYDYAKKQTKTFCELPVNPASFGSEAVEEEGIGFQQQILRQASPYPEVSAKLEILALSKVLEEYGFPLFDLAASSPKTDKTKTACAKAVKLLLLNTSLLAEMRRTKMLPLKKTEKLLDLPRKILERHRKYIITAVEILDGDYPVLSEYFRFIKEVQ